MSAVEVVKIANEVDVHNAFEFIADSVDDAHLVAELQFGKNGYSLESLGGDRWIASAKELANPERQIRLLVEHAVSLAQESNEQRLATSVLTSAIYELEAPGVKAARLRREGRERREASWRDLTRE